MLTIIHGTDIVASRKYFLDEKQKRQDSLTLDADSVNLTDLTQVIEGGGLFGESKFIFIEQFLTKRKKSGDYKDIITYLDTHADDHTIFLWENKELDIATQKAFKKAMVRPFKLPQTLFAMLDNVQPGKGQILVKQFHETIASTEVEMVFFMLIRQLRLLLALSPNQTINRHSGEVQNLSTNKNDDVSDSGQARMTLGEIEELKKLTWQRGKMQKQAEAFGTERLIALYNQLFAIEQGQKTGTLGLPLITAIDFFLLEV